MEKPIFTDELSLIFAVVTVLIFFFLSKTHLFRFNLLFYTCTMFMEKYSIYNKNRKVSLKNFLELS